MGIITPQSAEACRGIGTLYNEYTFALWCSGIIPTRLNDGRSRAQNMRTDLKTARGLPSYARCAKECKVLLPSRKFTLTDITNKKGKGRRNFSMVSKLCFIRIHNWKCFPGRARFSLTFVLWFVWWIYCYYPVSGLWRPLCMEDMTSTL